jgi:membrane protease YdiL (CAAX protease family)
MYLSWLYFRSGSLAPAMIAHAVFNTLNFLGLEFLKLG